MKDVRMAFRAFKDGWGRILEDSPLKGLVFLGTSVKFRRVVEDSGIISLCRAGRLTLGVLTMAVSELVACFVEMQAVARDPKP